MKKVSQERINKEAKRFKKSLKEVRYNVGKKQLFYFSAGAIWMQYELLDRCNKKDNRGFKK